MSKTQVGGLVRYIFRVKHLYKGSAQTDTLSVQSSGSSAACGSSFNLDTDYLIYSWLRDVKPQSILDLGPQVSPYLYTSICSRNKPDRFANFYEKAVLKLL
ncbi:hypothetical protein [Hymenobacter oligotrophus]|uniref:hypothetical protein n=1 Tax=Hymenobacter oligotrophus TaxID=2319843 RepID=UPI0013C37512|nr:hypothetical protein [Hymenobacter oligotrophus]